MALNGGSLTSGSRTFLARGLHHIPPGSYIWTSSLGRQVQNIIMKLVNIKKDILLTTEEWFIDLLRVSNPDPSREYKTERPLSPL